MNDHELFSSIIKEIPVTMLTTESAKTGILRSRPMTIQDAEFDGSLWFFAGLGTEVVRDVEANHQVNLSFIDAAHGSFLSAYGRGEIVEDPEQARKLWSPALQAWFPKGLQDPDLCLIRIDVAGADYWKSPGADVVKMFSSEKRSSDRLPGTPLGSRQHFSLG